MKKQRRKIPENGWLSIHSTRCNKSVTNQNADLDLAKNTLEPLLDHLKNVLFANGKIIIDRCEKRITLTADYPKFHHEELAAQNILDANSHKIQSFQG